MWVVIAIAGTIAVIVVIWLAVNVGYAVGKHTCNSSMKTYDQGKEDGYAEGFQDGYNVKSDNFFISNN